MFSNTEKRYNDYSTYIKNRFGERVQKISLNTGASCPNRDGTKGTGGCTYCNVNTFSPKYCRPKKTIAQQLSEGIAFFSKKYKTQKYLAYFQSYTNTYANLDKLKTMYWQAVSHPKIVGIIIGTRPDCINPKILEILHELSSNYYVSLEFGVESTLNKTLKLINRCHSFEETIEAFNQAQNNGLDLGAHLILNLPGESKQDILNHATELSKLPINTLKLHHLQIVKHTYIANQYKNNPVMFNLPTAEEYIELICEFISLLRKDIIIERFMSESPQELLIAPQWGGIKNFEMAARINKKLIMDNLSQGCKSIK